MPLFSSNFYGLSQLIWCNSSTITQQVSVETIPISHKVTTAPRENPGGCCSLTCCLEQGGGAQNQTYGFAVFGENVEEGKCCTS